MHATGYGSFGIPFIRMRGTPIVEMQGHMKPLRGTAHPTRASGARHSMKWNEENDQWRC